ncbi:hypothetical protein J056_000362 [Wallemia ichthyophaga EXF-994]|uniref:Major facilitator superfamily (MFS) profile domain-containing protein n=1 Tax=Wallemia ichthyophaga (strain EXF-994 / CBS 113033) TaxID=1299270 RepID=R9ARY8_WALI9|nr:uncharacterized protein J056_000362 [Wallemia ichthyophaga EXF-994]EOR04997.1 hypothetical protein J056_000362 [Wallemia ichthyophaga EXF-994]
MTQVTPNNLGFSPQNERRLLWKLDLRLIPILSLLYLISFIDRVNIGQAKVAGMVTSLGMTSHQFQIANTIFFSTYVAFEIIGNLLIKKFRPSRTLPVMITWVVLYRASSLLTRTRAWSAVLIGQAFAKNAGHLYTTRVLLGVFEASLFPGAIYIISLYYPRSEQTLRMGFLFSACVLAGAFGGVLAYGLSQIHGAGLEGWSYIFLIEGAMSFVVAVISFFTIVDLPKEAKFLSEPEREFVIHRIKQGQGALSLDVDFSWNHITSAILDYKLYIFASMYFCTGALLYALATFAPVIISQLGEWSNAQSQLLTVPPYALGFITTIGCAYISDKTGYRAFLIMLGTFVSLIGYILILVIPDHAPGAKYFSLFVMVAGFSPAAGIVLAWGAGSFGPTYKRGITQGVIMSAGNTAGILSSFLYPDSDKPDFVMGHSVSAAFSAFTFILAVALHFILKRENKQRDEKFGTLDEIYAIINEQSGGVSNAYTPEKDAKDAEDADAVNNLPSVSRNEFTDLPPVLIEKFGLHGLSKEDIANLGDKHPMFRYLC